MLDEQTQIRQLVTTWIEATEAGDVSKILPLLDDEVIFLVAGQAPMRGKQAFAAASAGLSQFNLNIAFEIQEIRLNGKWATCWNQLRVQIQPPNGQAPIIRTGDSFSLWQKHAHGWLLLRDANMLQTLKEE
ncbi:YybH family protein [Herpetosiphon llansteffanensis]|uniref:YybH family protein n=1 Tax=Herpetosiphon llansteffanensis TaxID=2094568 RepID=UPI0013E0AAEB|nr:SgcJ/EcaC family oxidoreductase [Herpetosiphon llansteffanensis]